MAMRGAVSCVVIFLQESQGALCAPVYVSGIYTGFDHQSVKFFAVKRNNLMPVVWLVSNHFLEDSTMDTFAGCTSVVSFFDSSFYQAGSDEQAAWNAAIRDYLKSLLEIVRRGPAEDEVRTGIFVLILRYGEQAVRFLKTKHFPAEAREAKRIWQEIQAMVYINTLQVFPRKLRAELGKAYHFTRLSLLMEETPFGEVGVVREPYSVVWHPCYRKEWGEYPEIAKHVRIPMPVLKEQGNLEVRPLGYNSGAWYQCSWRTAHGAYDFLVRIGEGVGFLAYGPWPSKPGNGMDVGPYRVGFTRMNADEVPGDDPEVKEFFRRVCRLNMDDFVAFRKGNARMAYFPSAQKTECDITIDGFIVTTLKFVPVPDAGNTLVVES